MSGMIIALSHVIPRYITRLWDFKLPAARPTQNEDDLSFAVAILRVVLQQYSKPLNFESSPGISVGMLSVRLKNINEIKVNCYLNLRAFCGIGPPGLVFITRPVHVVTK